MVSKPRSNAERSSERTPAWADKLVRLLDDGLTIPGTRIGIGLDALLGFLFPTLGDALTGLGSLSLLVLAFQMRLPKVVVLRVVFNIALDVLLGCVPFVGDAFDLFWRSNRRNLQLLQRYTADPLRRPDALDYLIVAAGFALVAAAIILPLLLGAWLLHWVWRNI
ncbi:MAG TPA: DUF4112 domain-containing protein [Polyangiaceae bacterium]|nr:DUF4112 domain-containing protein [Polyangiaceae bacterium]